MLHYLLQLDKWLPLPCVVSLLVARMFVLTLQELCSVWRQAWPAKLGTGARP